MITLSNWGGRFLFFFKDALKPPTHKVEPRHYQPLLSPEVKRKFEAAEHICSEEVGKKLEGRLHGSF